MFLSSADTLKAKDENTDYGCWWIARLNDQRYEVLFFLLFVWTHLASLFTEHSSVSLETSSSIGCVSGSYCLQNCGLQAAHHMKSAVSDFLTTLGMQLSLLTIRQLWTLNSSFFLFATVLALQKRYQFHKHFWWSVWQCSTVTEAFSLFFSGKSYRVSSKTCSRLAGKPLFESTLKWITFLHQKELKASVGSQSSNMVSTNIV